MNSTPIKKGDPRTEAILESLRNGGSIIAACRGAGIHPSTFWLWRKADPDLNAETEAAIASRVMIVEDALYTACLKGNPTAMIFFLMNRAGERWKDKRAVTNLNASASASSEANSGNIEAAKKRLTRNLRIIKELGISLEPEGKD